MALFILFARRYAQMLDPQVWDEEGRIITQMVASGPLCFFTPMNGYLILLPRILAFLALLVPMREYPRVGVMLAWMVIVAIMIAVALMPSRIAGGPLLVAATMLVPSDPELFGLLLYTFWWTVPLLYAAYFWTHDQTISWARVGAIVLSGLSAPAIVAVAPLFVLRAVRERTRDNIAAGAAALLCALVQLSFIVRTNAAGVHLSFVTIELLIEKLIGGYVAWNFLPNRSHDTVSLIAGLLTVAFIATAILRERPLRPTLYALLYLWLAATALSLARVDVAKLDQVGAGPRYYFLPFVLEGWILVQIVAKSHISVVRAGAVLILMCAAFNALPVLSRTHADLHWKASVAACAAAPDAAITSIPIQYDGNVASHWDIKVSGFDCRRMGRFGLAGLLVRP